jgi:hypothetical protein
MPSAIRLGDPSSDDHSREFVILDDEIPLASVKSSARFAIVSAGHVLVSEHLALSDAIRCFQELGKKRPFLSIAIYHRNSDVWTKL